MLAWLGLLSIVIQSKNLTKIKSSLQFAQFGLVRTTTIRDFVLDFTYSSMSNKVWYCRHDEKL